MKKLVLILFTILLAVIIGCSNTPSVVDGANEEEAEGLEILDQSEESEPLVPLFDLEAYNNDTSKIDEIIESGQVSKCDGLSDGNLRETCQMHIYMNTAIENLDDSLCQKIKGDTTIQACINQIALIKAEAEQLN